MLACLSICPRVASQPQEKSSGQLTLQVIVVDSADKARQIRERLLNGEDFAAIAKKESIDPSATSGGNLGLIDLSTLRPELREALKRIAPGRVTEVIAVIRWHIFSIASAQTSRWKTLSLQGSTFKSLKS